MIVSNSTSVIAPQSSSSLASFSFFAMSPAPAAVAASELSEPFKGDASRLGPHLLDLADAVLLAPRLLLCLCEGVDLARLVRVEPLHLHPLASVRDDYEVSSEVRGATRPAPRTRLGLPFLQVSQPRSGSMRVSNPHLASSAWKGSAGLRLAMMSWAFW